MDFNWYGSAGLAYEAEHVRELLQQGQKVNECMSVY